MQDKIEEFLADMLPALIEKHQLPAEFRATAENFYLPLVNKLSLLHSDARPLLLGINGAQGTGKSTLAEFLQLATQHLFGWQTAVLSIDDFYLTRAERQKLGRDVHPLFETRGVPGTHDTAMLKTYMHRLERLAAGETLLLPKFDKASDDRAPQTQWNRVEGPLDLIVLEGWCVGSEAQAPDALRVPVNTLERVEDPTAIWRTTANEYLATTYKAIFSRLDALVFLVAPSFDAIHRWRLEQEQKLTEPSATSAAAIMNEDQLRRFIQFYERLTRHNLDTLADSADFVLTLDAKHAVVSSKSISA
ncbi:MAG: phosphoribulokinase [Woeseiaceae bacterium]